MKKLESHAEEAQGSGTIDRRRMLKSLGASGAAVALSGRAASWATDPGSISTDDIRQAEWLSGLEFNEAERELMLDEVRDTVAGYERLRAVPIDNIVPPALHFEPIGGRAKDDLQPAEREAQPLPPRALEIPISDEDLAFASLAEQAAVLQTGHLSAVDLTRLYLERLVRFDPELRCVVTLLEEMALEQAERADRERALGRVRGPLHGIPWGAKDLLAVPGAPTTWGATPYQDQVRSETSTVVTRLTEAGAVLLAKLSVGALAWGDVWFGGMTRNPWNPEAGSSGSSAGSASATAAGLATFTIGTETWGSIVSPCTECGATGLRPTYGRVSRYGAMALSWSMDKIGPIARSAEDCALVFDAIHGVDPLDPTARTRPFHWPPRRFTDRMRVGYVQSAFEQDRTHEAEDNSQKARLALWQQFDLRTLATLRELGVELVPIELPSDLPIDDLALILNAEATAAFDELTRTGRDDSLVRQSKDAWPNVFRQSQLIPAVEYIRANRIRTLVMHEMERTLDGLDAYVCPSFVGSNLLLTNLTGHPCVVVPNGFDEAGAPTSITFLGPLWADDRVLGLAHRYQQATDFHRRRPPVSS